MSKYKLVPVVLPDAMSDVLFYAIRDGDADCLTTETVYAELLAAAPEVPKLSDERILEIWASNSGRPVTMGKARIIAQARAIEREILGGEHE